jgi:hypothetical protein
MLYYHIANTEIDAMAIGYDTLLKIRRFEKTVEELGMRIGHPKHGGWSRNDENVLALFPLNEELPVFSRDAELFVGTLEAAEIWIQGLEWSRNYDYLLRVSDDKKRTRKEQDTKNSILMKKIKESEKAK